MFAGANEDLAIADCGGGTEVFGIGCQTIGRQFFEGIAGLEHMDLSRTSDVIDLAVADHG